MSNVTVANTALTQADTLIEVYDRGLNGQPDVLVQTVTLSATLSPATLGIGPTRFLVVREAGDGDGKTIDNWATAPAPGPAPAPSA